MGADSRRKGGEFERKVVGYYRDRGWALARRALTPAEGDDLGDIINIPGVTQDCKNREVIRIPKWMEQLDEIVARSGDPLSALIVKRKGVEDVRMSFVICHLDQWRGLLQRSGAPDFDPTEELLEGPLTFGCLLSEKGWWTEEINGNNTRSINLAEWATSVAILGAQLNSSMRFTWLRRYTRDDLSSLAICDLELFVDLLEAAGHLPRDWVGVKKTRPEDVDINEVIRELREHRGRPQ